jgi:hypothetical protein
LNNAFWVGGNSFNVSGVVEVDLSWLVIINNGNSSLSILACKLISCFLMVKLAEEILIWLPVVVIEDHNFKELLFLALFEYNSVVNSFVIISSFSFSESKDY